MRNLDTPKSGIRGISWNSTFEKWHVRIRVRVDGKVRYASFGLYDDLATAKETVDKARAGLIKPNDLRTRGESELRKIPTFVTRPGTVRPDLTAVATVDLVTELHRRGART